MTMTTDNHGTLFDGEKIVEGCSSEPNVVETANMAVPANTNPDGDNYLSFELDPNVVAYYADEPVEWGFPVGGDLTLGELTFLQKYSRLRTDGTKETWSQCVERVIDGMYSIQRNYCRSTMVSWDDNKAQESAREAYARHWAMKWTAPGRGLATMGTEFVGQFGSASLQNCSFWSTEDLAANPTKAFIRLMEESMLGIGVGFDARGAGTVDIAAPGNEVRTWQIPDSREGWCESVRLLLASYLSDSHPTWEFDYSVIRPAGTELKSFGGTASGPGPLKRLHDQLRDQFGGRAGEAITSRDIVDVANKIGQAVVAGAKRRSAEIALGDVNDEDYVSLKDWNLPENAERTGPAGWAWTSNNSVLATVDDDLSHIAPMIAVNGEPGIVFSDMITGHGRLCDGPDGKDMRVRGVNPCAEMQLETSEKCTLVEVHMNKAEGKEDFLRTLKFAFLYAKTVTLMPTHWEDVNTVMARNRRIGVGLTGVAQFLEDNGIETLRDWMRDGYAEVRKWDELYSEWLCVRESVRVTTVKPAGSTSLLSGATAGVHWPTMSGKFIRTMRFARNHELVDVLDRAGFLIEPDAQAPDTGVVVTFATDGPEMRDQYQVSLWQKAMLAAETQRWWADNAVSVTMTYQQYPDDPHRDESNQIGDVISMFKGQLKTMSFLPIDDSGTTYAQAPYQPVDAATFAELRARVDRIDRSALYAMQEEAAGERYCDGDTCVL